MLQLPRLDFTPEAPQEPITLQVELAPQPSPAQATVATPAPEPIEPAEPEPVHTPEPPPIPKKPRPPKPKPAPKIPEPPAPSRPPVTEPAPVPETVPAEEVATPEVMTTTAPLTTPVPAPVAPVHTPAPEPPPANTGPSQEDINAARNRYSGLLSRAIAKYKQYPKIAQMRGWTGEVVLEVHCDEQGQVMSIQVKQSSGHKVLDEQAMTMVNKASPLPQPPEILRNNKHLVILVPVPFTLETP